MAGQPQTAKWEFTALRVGERCYRAVFSGMLPTVKMADAWRRKQGWPTAGHWREFKSGQIFARGADRIGVGGIRVPVYEAHWVGPD